MGGGADVASVNEEQLFAGIIHDRIALSKGEDLAREYDTLLEAKMAEHTRADGFVYVEEAARAALKDLENSGQLTTEEAETIHAQAFQAAQLDDNTGVLWDSRGATMSVAPTATAMAAMTLDHLSGGRFVLGLGVSGPQVVEGWYGQRFERPLERTREYVEILRRVFEDYSRRQRRFAAAAQSPSIAGAKPDRGHRTAVRRHLG